MAASGSSLPSGYTDVSHVSLLGVGLGISFSRAACAPHHPTLNADFCCHMHVCEVSSVMKNISNGMHAGYQPARRPLREQSQLPGEATELASLHLKVCNARGHCQAGVLPDPRKGGGEKLRT